MPHSGEVWYKGIVSSRKVPYISMEHSSELVKSDEFGNLCSLDPLTSRRPLSQGEKIVGNN